MLNKSADITLRAIGTVKNAVQEPLGPEYNWQDTASEIVLDNSLAGALDGLENFSHIIVLYWMHRVSYREPFSTKIHPRGNPELPLVGRFATRSPHRPNPLGMSTARLLERKGNILKVKGLDAIDGTPVIDIKPHIPGSDSPEDAETPLWVDQR
jgi:tRNA-Thr(GGU) m(6)t(6)A37 methyltransferase TsaA